MLSSLRIRRNSLHGVPFSSHTSNIPKMPIKSQKMEEPAVCSAQRRIAWHYSPSVPEDDEQQNIDSTTEGQTTKVPLELKRPIAFSFLRRPTSASELSSMAQHRQRLGRQKPKIGQKHSVDSPKSLPELSIHEEMLRFGCENLLTFHYQTEKEKQSK
ncbi:hypothetical protein niasHT_022163 [Heterodera trifolii]|uniref:Uncharacterized protein n=1 Tax=Heterodera trifolii TaxID=157864 RepID=A0ABD2KPI9_9BILA